ncbi:hypothetical protein C9374_004195 [Naegleria lovaniensis]|uniref:Uncharacterized protein n=1 Tax=Naegleria lovaniensis TaxID=51637 RepID=A0AA88KJ36_NAELO|nr:uncharacterized protein C9374_004195 [Naegleria lovaniensis]KAG2383524.1 hypothetical protein C9374_004195 [Naegleria lovaniensis]
MNMNNGNSALTNQQGGSCSFAQNSTATPFINNPNLGNNGNTSMTNSSSKATQHTSFHDYSYHFQSKAENPSPKIFFHNITFPVNSSTNYTVTNNGRNNNLQGSSQLNSMNVNNIGMSSNSVTVSTTDNLNSLNADASSQITPSIPHQVSIQEQIFNSTNVHGAAALDS